MTTNQPNSVEQRLNRLESLFADVGDLVIAQNEAIDALTANLNNLTEQTTHNINALAEQAALDRQAWQAETNRIWNYLLGLQPGNGRTDIEDH